jgi:hypothetical protein
LRAEGAESTTPSRITVPSPPSRQIRARDGGGSGWYLEVDKAQVRIVEDGLRSCRLDMTVYLQSSAAEGRSCYQVGSEFCARAEEEFADVQNDQERRAMRESLEGARMKWKRGAEETRTPSGRDTDDEISARRMYKVQGDGGGR